MIEILFGDSEAGAMKAAKRKENPEKVICLNLMLDIGNLEESVDSPYRKEIIYSMWKQCFWGERQEIDEELKVAADIYVKELHRLKSYVENGEELRIWYCDKPYSLCALYFLCHWLNGYHNPIKVIKLPEYNINRNRIRTYQNWGAISAEEFVDFLPYEKPLGMKERQMFGRRWRELVKDNMPLRAVISGQVVGVPEDFYDFIIWKKLTNRHIKQARLVGDILGEYLLDVSDEWYGSRIEKFIKEGKIKVIEDSTNLFARTICKA